MATAPTYHNEVTENGDNIQVENTPEYTAFMASQKKAADDAAAKKISDLTKSGMGNTFSQVDKYLSSHPNQSEYTDPKTGIVYSRYVDSGSGGDTSTAGTGETLGYGAFDPKTKMVMAYDLGGNLTYNKKQVLSKGMLGDLMASPIAPILIGVLAPELLPMLGNLAVPAMTAALGVAAGQDPTAILKNAGLSYLGGQAADFIKGSSGVIDAIGQTGANAAANAAKSFVTSDGKIDPVAALLSGGVNAGVGAIIGNIPGFDGLDKSTQSLVTKAISSTLSTGKLDPVSLARAAFQAGTSAMANATNTPNEATTNAANDEFLKTLAPYLSSDQNTGSYNEYPPETKGNVTNDGKFEPDPLGSTTYGQMNPAVSGNVNNMKDWSFDDKTGEWMRTDPVTGEKTTYDYKTPITGTAQTGAQIENKAGAAPATSPSGTPKASTPIAGTPTAGTPTAGTSSSPTVSRVGLDPLDVLRMKNDVAHINPLEELFGGSIYDHKRAPAEQKDTASEADIVKALEDTQGTQDYSGGGDIHALLQLLRS
jgi:hypothetical protein